MKIKNITYIDYDSVKNNWISYKINSLMNLYNIILHYEDNTVYRIDYPIEHNNKLNKNLLSELIKVYKEYGVEIIKHKEQEHSISLDIRINTELNEFRNKLKVQVYNKINSIQKNYDTDKLINLYLFKILENNDIHWSSWNNIVLHEWYFKELWIIKDEMVINIDDIEKDRNYYNLIERIDFSILVLLYLYLNGNLSYIGNKIDLDRLWIHSWEYVVNISQNLNRAQLNSFSDISNQLKNIQSNTKSIKVSKKNNDFILEKEHVFYWDQTKYIDLVNRFPYSDITWRNYLWKVNKYIVIEKIKINNTID